MLREHTGNKVVDEPGVDLTANLTGFFLPPASISSGPERFQQNTSIAQKRRRWISPRNYNRMMQTLVCGLMHHPRDLSVKYGLKEENPHLAREALQ